MIAYLFMDNHGSGIAHKVNGSRSCTTWLRADKPVVGGRCRPFAAVRRAMRNRELGPPHAGGEPHRRAKRVAGSSRRLNHPARVYRRVARPHLSRPQHARVVRAAIRE